MSETGPTFLNIAFTTPLRVIHEQGQVGKQFVSVILGNFIVKAEGGHIMYTLPVGMQVQMQVSYVDSGGNPATIDGVVAWASSNEAIVTATVDAADSTIVTIVPIGGLGQVQVTATADADLGAGVTTLITIADIEIVAGQAVAGTISPVGSPVPIP